MKTLIIGLILAASSCVAADLTEQHVDRIADGIYKIEGGDKAKAPYGILSVKVRDKRHARSICEQTIRNNWTRWIKAGKPGAFLDYLADKYCPKSADPRGNRNWKSNIRKVTALSF